VDVTDETELEIRARAHAHYAAGVIHDLNEEPDLALQEYYKAAANDPDDESLILEISRRLILAKQPEKALDLLREAAVRPEASGAIFARLGLVCLQLDRNAEALEAGRTAVKRSPLLLAGYHTLFKVYLLNNRDEEALNTLDQAGRRQDSDAEFLVGLAELYAAYVVQFPSKRDVVQPKMLAVLERAAKLSSDSTMLTLRLADGLAMVEKFREAAVFYEQTLPDLDSNPFLRDAVRMKLTEIYLRIEDFQRARLQLEATVRDDPSNARAYYLLGTIAVSEKRWTDAANDLDKAILFGPRFEQAYYDLAGVQLAASESSKALATLEMARQRFPQNFRMEFLSGMAYSQSKAYAEAIQHFTAAEVAANGAGETNRLNEGFYFQLGVANERKGDIEQAERYFKKAIEMSPKFAEALNYLGYMWAERGVNLEEAKALIERALRVDPKSAAYVDSMGWVLFKLGQTESALEYILKAVSLSEEPDAELFNHLGDIYAAMNEPEKARDAWRKALSIGANDAIQRKLDEMKARESGRQ
jgi:tetratricopeptide (TPR) repeat protein